MSSSELQTEFLDYFEGQTRCEAFVVYDAAGSARQPTILLAHAWDGQNEAIRQRAHELARLGYLVFALDLYGKGVRGGEHEDNSQLMNPFLEDRGLLRRRVLAAVEAARQHPRVNPDRLAALGYCFGGLCALDLARSGVAGLRATVSFHGILRAPEGLELPAITSKVLVLHGWEDPVAPPADVLALARELTAAGADWQLHAFGHARHAFTFRGANLPALGILYDPLADRRSWQAMTLFLSEAL